jgi:hypothetical protein
MEKIMAEFQRRELYESYEIPVSRSHSVELAEKCHASRRLKARIGSLLTNGAAAQLRLPGYTGL